MESQLEWAPLILTPTVKLMRMFYSTIFLLLLAKLEQRYKFDMDDLGMDDVSWG